MQAPPPASSPYPQQQQPQPPQQQPSLSDLILQQGAADPTHPPATAADIPMFGFSRGPRVLPVLCPFPCLDLI